VREQCAAIGLDPARIEIIYGGIELDRYTPSAHPRDIARRDLAPLGITADTPLVVHVARLAEVKGHAYVVAAAKEVVAAIPGARFLLVGPAWPGWDARVQSMIAEAGLEGSVRWIGKVEDVARVLGAADIGLVASIGSEALSRVALEYMAMGLPTVATRVGSLPELVEDGRTGTLVPPRDSHALAAAVIALLKDAPTRAKMAAAARARAEERFGAPAQVDRLEALYARIVGPR